MVQEGAADGKKSERSFATASTGLEAHSHILQFSGGKVEWREATRRNSTMNYFWLMTALLWTGLSPIATVWKVPIPPMG
jgi:hypothetical protein